MLCSRQPLPPLISLYKISNIYIYILCTILQQNTTENILHYVTGTPDELVLVLPANSTLFRKGQPTVSRRLCVHAGTISCPMTFPAVSKCRRTSPTRFDHARGLGSARVRIWVCESRGRIRQRNDHRCATSAGTMHPRRRRDVEADPPHVWRTCGGLGSGRMVV